MASKKRQEATFLVTITVPKTYDTFHGPRRVSAAIIKKEIRHRVGDECGYLLDRDDVKVRSVSRVQTNKAAGVRAIVKKGA